MKKWYQQKTFWAGVALIGKTVWPAVIAMELAQVDFNIVIAGLAIIFLRQSVEARK